MMQRMEIADLDRCSSRRAIIPGRRVNFTPIGPTMLSRARTSAVRTLGRFPGQHQMWTAIFQGMM